MRRACASAALGTMISRTPKDASARGSWTISRLISENVLGSVQDHLAGGDSVRLVLSTVATDLSALTERAATSGTPAEFHGTLTASQGGELARQSNVGIRVVSEGDLNTQTRKFPIPGKSWN